MFKPKGKNVTEDKDLKGNTQLGQVGTDEDPSRAAELKFEKENAASGAVSNKDIAQGGDSKFSGLGDETA